MDYNPWGDKESDTTERLSLHFTEQHFTKQKASAVNKSRQILERAVDIRKRGLVQVDEVSSPRLFSPLDARKLITGHN